MKKYSAPLFKKCSAKMIQNAICGRFSESKWCFGCTNCNCNWFFKERRLSSLLFLNWEVRQIIMITFDCHVHMGILEPKFNDENKKLFAYIKYKKNTPRLHLPQCVKKSIAKAVIFSFPLMEYDFVKQNDYVLFNKSFCFLVKKLIER